MSRPRRALAPIVLTLLLVSCVGREGWLPKATLSSVDPASGAVTEDTRITLSGANFHRLVGSGPGQRDNLLVQVCGVPLEKLALAVESERAVMLPPASNVLVQIGNEVSGVLGAGAQGGISDVTVTLPDGQQLLLPAAFDCQVPGVSVTISTDVASGPAPLTVTFDGGGSTSATGVISEYQWDFGSDATGAGETVSHTFTDVGIHEVTLLVIDDTGASGESTVQIEVVNSAPVAVVSVEPASGTADAPVTVTFDAGASSDADGDIITYDWIIDGLPAGTGATVSHTFGRSGNYDVNLVVTDSRGAISSSRLHYSVGNSAPVAVFTTTPDTAIGAGPLLVTFDASGSHDPDGAITGYQWDFGDGATGTGSTVSHTFMSGTYTVTLSVEDDEGHTSSVTGQVLVDNTPPLAQFTVSVDPATGPAPLTVQFDASESSDADGSIVSYAWEFGTSGTGSGVSPEHTFLRSGNQTVTLTVTDNEGATATADLLVIVSNASPVAAASVTAVDGYEVSFSAAGSYDPDGGPLTYSWDVADGSSIITAETFTHTYSQSGDYEVTLVVTDSESGTDSRQVVARPINFAPTAIANTDPSPASGYAPLSVNLAATPGSLDQHGGEIISYEWKLAGDVISDSAVHDHVFSSEGVHTVTLTVTDNEGTADSVDVAVEVLASEVQTVWINEGDQGLLGGEVVSLTATVVGLGNFDLAVEWQSSDPGVASVSSSGEVTALADGTATITATSVQNPAVSDSVQVSVRIPLGTALDERILDVAVDQDDNIYLTGSVNSAGGATGTDILLIKLDPQGRLLWRETYGTPYADSARAIALDPVDNSIILAGETHGNLETGAIGNSHDLFLMKINAADRTPEWTYQYGGPGWDLANDLIVDSYGDIYFTGAFNRGANSNCPADCGRIIVGHADSTGTSVNVVLHGHNTAGTGEAIALDNDGNIVVAGNSLGVFNDQIQGGSGAYLMEVDPVNLAERTKLVFIDSSAMDYADEIHVAPDGSIIWVGRDNTLYNQYASTVILVFNPDYSERSARWFEPMGGYYSVAGSFLDSDGLLVIGANLSGVAMELSRLNMSNLETVASVQVAVPASPEPPYAHLRMEGVAKQTDGTIVAAGYTDANYFEPNQGDDDPFVWIVDPW